jgi:hypothetical protein
MADTLKASRFVRSIAAMIAGKLEGYAALMEDPAVQEALSQSQCEADPGSALGKGILTRLEHLHAPEDGPRYLLIDALDESLLAPPGSLTIVDLLASRLDRLPAWLKIVATTRKEAPVLDRLAGLRAETLDAQSPENLADVRQFLEARLSSPNLAEKLVESQLSASVVTETLGAKSAGNFSGAVAALPSERPQRRILRLLEEALRRDIHFIARHAQDYPQGLFQCLWNSGWWYDCPEAAQH